MSDIALGLALVIIMIIIVVAVFSSTYKWLIPKRDKPRRRCNHERIDTEEDGLICTLCGQYWEKNDKLYFVSNNPKHIIKCSKCGVGIPIHGNQLRVTCPACGRQTEIDEEDEEE